MAAREQKRLLNVLIVRQELKHGRINQEVLCGCYCGFKPHYLSPLVLTQKTEKNKRHLQTCRQAETKGLLNMKMQ